MYEGNILFVYDGSSTARLSARWLCTWPIDALTDAGYFVDGMTLGDVLDPTRRQRMVLDRADIIIYERHIEENWYPFFDWALSKKRFFLTLDDAYWLADPSSGTHAFWSKNGRLQKLMEVADAAEGVIVPSRKLAKHFKKGIFRPNRPNLKDPDWIVSPLFGEKSILWGGTSGHIAGMRNHPCLGAIERVCKEDGAHFLGFTDLPEMKALLEKYGRVIGMQQYSDWLRAISGATLVICPLGKGYDEYRSWIKALEATLMGTRWLGSERGVYDYVSGGAVVDDTEEDWYEALKEALHEPYDTEGPRAWAWKQGLHDHLDEWERIFNAQ